MDRDIVGLTRPLPACPAGEAEVPRLRRGPSQLSVSRPLAGGPMGGGRPGGCGYSVGFAWELVHRPDKPAGVPGDPWEVGNQATSRVCSTQPLSAINARSVARAKWATGTKYQRRPGCLPPVYFFPEARPTSLSWRTATQMRTSALWGSRRKRGTSLSQCLPLHIFDRSVILDFPGVLGFLL